MKNTLDWDRRATVLFTLVVPPCKRVCYHIKLSLSAVYAHITSKMVAHP